MDEFDTLDDRIDQAQDVDDVRLEIADLIGRLVADRRDRVGYWEKFWFDEALRSLAQNIAQGQRDSTTWLRAALVATRNAVAPDDRRDPDYAPRDARIEALSADQLLARVRGLGGHG